MNEKTDIPISDTDELTVAGGPANDKTRHLRNYKRTNAPLSAHEIEQRKKAWPLQGEDVEEMVPLPDEKPRE